VILPRRCTEPRGKSEHEEVTVCLSLTIKAPMAALASLQALARSPSSELLRLGVEPFRPWPWSPATSARASIIGEGGCACSLLAEDADWDAPFWAMRPEVPEPLAGVLAAVGEAVPDGFSVAALWTGDAAQREQIVSVSELVALAREGQLGNRVCYRVLPSHSVQRGAGR
jgi:hypothetical protein